MKELLGQNYNQTGTWLDNLPVTNCLQQLCCSLLRLSLFYYVTALFIQVINIKKVSPKGYYYENKELQRGRLFRCWSSPSESAVSWPVWEPLLHFPPPKTHTESSLARHTQWPASTLTNHRVTKKVRLFLFFLPLPPSHFLSMQSSTYHVQTKQCPHVSVVQPQRLGKILSGQLQVFQPPLCVLHLCEEV